MSPRMTVFLTDEEKSAIVLAAAKEKRDPRFQAAMLLRRVLEEEGYLNSSDKEKEQEVSDAVQ